MLVAVEPLAVVEPLEVVEPLVEPGDCVEYETVGEEFGLLCGAVSCTTRTPVLVLSAWNILRRFGPVMIEQQRLLVVATQLAPVYATDANVVTGAYMEGFPRFVAGEEQQRSPFLICKHCAERDSVALEAAKAGAAELAHMQDEARGDADDLWRMHNDDY